MPKQPDIHALCGAMKKLTRPVTHWLKPHNREIFGVALTLFNIDRGHPILS